MALATHQETLQALFESQRTVDAQKQKIAAQESELRRLRKALRVFTEEPKNDKDKDADGDVKMREVGMEKKKSNKAAGKLKAVIELSDDDDDDDSISEPESQVEYLPETPGQPTWFELDEIYRCSVCNWEVAERRCEGCGRDYSDWICDESPNSEPLQHNDDIYRHYGEEHDYRTSTPRGTTPLPSIHPGRLLPETIAYGYGDRMEEYANLLARGASRLMCETFRLSFTYQDGIWVEVQLGDEDGSGLGLLDEWAGPDMFRQGEGGEEGPGEEEEGRFVSWKICLGREIRLDKDGSDEDGSRYIDEFLEEALLFNADTGTLSWETVEEEGKPGCWVTRPVMDEERWTLGEEKQVVRNDYDDLSDSELAEEDEDEDEEIKATWDNEGGWGPKGTWSDDVPGEAQAVNTDEEMSSDGDSFDSDWDSQDEQWNSMLDEQEKQAEGVKIESEASHE